MKANDKQVGGSHYNARTQTWDYIVDNGLNFLSGSIVAYLARWERKGNQQDLDKAEHYMQKLMECVREGRLKPARFNHPPLLRPHPDTGVAPAHLTLEPGKVVYNNGAPIPELRGGSGGAVYPGCGGGGDYDERMKSREARAAVMAADRERIVEENREAKESTINQGDTI